MRVRMLTTQRGAEDGVRVREFLEGKEYDLAGTASARDLAAVFVREGWAEQIGSGARAPGPARADHETRPGDGAASEADAGPAHGRRRRR